MSDTAQTTPAALSLHARRQWLAFAALFLLATIAALYAAGAYGRSAALSTLEAQGRIDANLKVALLRAVLERPRALPFLLSRDRDVAEALSATSDAAKRDFLDRKLEELVVGTSAAVIYVIDTKGLAIAASNWQEPTSFVGNDYSFRAYFSRAMKEGTAEHFALGSVSKRPGLYISHRIGPASAPLGVVVVKMEFDQLEKDWHETQRPSYVVDATHVVLITSIPSWRFMTTEPLPAASLAAIRESLQFGEAPLAPLPFQRVGDGLIRAVQPGGGAETYLKIAVPVVSTPWQFEYLVPVAGAVATGTREARLIALISLCTLALLAAIWLRRRQTALAGIAREQAAREELERRVVERTRDLSLARDSLQAEISDHRQTETRLQSVQQDLVQANRLAILGQVAAGVAHEINQPLATIRAYADNSKVFVERGKSEPVLENLGLIAGLTDRIATITEDLKALARKGRSGEEPVDLRDVIDGAIMLLRSRFTGRLDRLVIADVEPDLRVMGNRLQLEQVFINLFQNALEAVGERADGRVAVAATLAGADVAISVSDNGPGISPEIMASLFEPFNTSKEKGLGLGLVIVKDIVSDYGGRLEVQTGSEGASFIVHLRKAAA